jgi:predicted transcriptional regulator
VPQPAVARIETGRVDPRLDTLDRLLEACGRALVLAVRPGSGVDRTTMRELLSLSPRERLDRAMREGRNLERLVRTSRP